MADYATQTRLNGQKVSRAAKTREMPRDCLFHVPHKPHAVRGKLKERKKKLQHIFKRRRNHKMFLLLPQREATNLMMFFDFINFQPAAGLRDGLSAYACVCMCMVRVMFTVDCVQRGVCVICA